MTSISGLDILLCSHVISLTCLWLLWQGASTCQIIGALRQALPTIASRITGICSLILSDDDSAWLILHREIRVTWASIICHHTLTATVVKPTVVRANSKRAPVWIIVSLIALIYGISLKISAWQSTKFTRICITTVYRCIWIDDCTLFSTKVAFSVRLRCFLMRRIRGLWCKTLLRRRLFERRQVCLDRWESLLEVT